MDQLIDIHADEMRLDMACGTGRLTNYATHGLDASAEMMAHAIKRHPSVQFTQASATATVFPDNMFDVVFSFHLLMHLNPATVEGIFKEVHRILKPGGRFIIDIPSKKRRQLFHHRQASWHGALEMTITEVERMAAAGRNTDGGNESRLFALNRTFGIMMLPLHRLPERIRKPLLRIDYAMANGWAKEYSSYLICELIKR